MDIERNIVVIKKSVHINNKFKKSLSNKTLLCICYCKTVIFNLNIWTGSVCLTSPPPQGYFTSDTYSQLPGEVWNRGLTMKYWPVASRFTCTPALCALFCFFFCTKRNYFPVQAASPPVPSFQPCWHFIWPFLSTQCSSQHLPNHH